MIEAIVIGVLAALAVTWIAYFTWNYRDSRDYLNEQERKRENRDDLRGMFNSSGI